MFLHVGKNEDGSDGNWSHKGQVNACLNKVLENPSKFGCFLWITKPVTGKMTKVCSRVCGKDCHHAGLFSFHEWRRKHFWYWSCLCTTMAVSCSHLVEAPPVLLMWAGQFRVYLSCRRHLEGPLLGSPCETQHYSSTPGTWEQHSTNQAAALWFTVWGGDLHNSQHHIPFSHGSFS